MKKGLTITIVFIILFLSGCKNTQDDINKNTDSTEAENSQSTHMVEKKPTQSETDTQPETETTPNIVYDFDWWDLKRVIIDGKTVVEYDYNDIGLRSAKRGIDDCKFEYDENKNLIKEEQNGKVITYFYKEDEEYQYWHIIGFSYEGKNYYYTRDNLKRIDGIQNESGELVAKYDYGENDFKVEAVMRKQDEIWFCTDDADFIGNINKIRDSGAYYDEECGLYYDGVFFDAITGYVILNS